MFSISDVRSEPPMLRVPISLMIDDWSFGYLGTGGDIPINLEFDRAYNFLLDIINLGRRGVRGKLSLVPYITKPKGVTHKLRGDYILLGCISKGVKGLPKHKLLEALNLLKGEATRYFDITPEMLTHTLALDVDSESLLDETEWEWSQRQDLDSLTKYIAHGLSVLRQVGLRANGITCPCDFGKEIEGVLVRAVLEAEKLINHIRLTWYFLHVEPIRDGWRGSSVNPRLMYLDSVKGEAVTSIVSCSKEYITSSMIEKAGGDIYRLADNWIRGDGKGGRLIELYQEGAYLTFHIHWYNAHRREDNIGFKVVEETISRINRFLGDKVLWMKCNEIARYFTASKSFKFKTYKQTNGVKLRFEAPFHCQNFTISMKTYKEIEHVKVNGVALRNLKEGTLKPNTWMMRNGRLYLCFNLINGVTVEIKH